MPMYEYECTTCHRRTEKIQKFSDVELTVCPHCGGRLERTITAAAVSFKGGGWFKDGYGSVKPAAANGGEGGSTPAGTGGESGGASSEAAAATPASPAAAPAAGPATAGPATAPASKPAATPAAAGGSSSPAPSKA